MLASPVLEPVTLVQLWPLLCETNLHAPLEQTWYQPLHVTLSPGLGVGANGMDTAGISLPPAVTDTPVAERPPLVDFLARYPALRGWATRTPAGTDVTWPQPGLALGLTWELSAADARSEHVLQRRLTRYRGHRMAFPATQGASENVHPLMAWWAVLYALSMLTRYEPARWTTSIDVNASEHATAVEYALDTALAAVPDLVAETIELIST